MTFLFYWACIVLYCPYAEPTWNDRSSSPYAESARNLKNLTLHWWILSHAFVPLISTEHVVKIRWKICYCAEVFLVALAPGLPSIKRLTNSVFLSGSTSRIYTRDSRKNKRPLQPATTVEGKAPTFNLCSPSSLCVAASRRKKGRNLFKQQNLFIFWYTSIVVSALLAGSGTWSLKSLFPSRVARVFVFLPSTGRKSKWRGQQLQGGGGRRGNTTNNVVFHLKMCFRYFVGQKLTNLDVLQAFKLQ
jgi:hypothetical protein